MLAYIRNKQEEIREVTDNKWIYAFLFLSGFLTGYITYFLYRWYSRRKLIRSLYENHFNEIGEESEPFNRLSTGTLISGGYGAIETQRKLSISNPISLSRNNNPMNEMYSNYSNIPSLPKIINLESEARWLDYNRKKNLAKNIIKHSTEPPLGLQLRLCVRSSMHFSEVSPEAIALDSTLDPLEVISLNNTNNNARQKYGHRHSKSVNSMQSNKSIKGKPYDEQYSSHGSILVSGDSLRARSTSLINRKDVIPNSSKNPPKLRNKIAQFNLNKENQNQNIPLLEVFSDSEDIDVKPRTRKDSLSKDNTKLKVPNRPKRSNTININENKTNKMNLKLDTKITENKNVKFEDNKLNSSILFGGKEKSTSKGMIQPLLDKNYFNNEITYEFNIPNYGKIKFTDHAPMAFRMIRKSFGYHISDFDKALINPFSSVTSTAGKSEAIFFLTNNNAKFLFKTLRNSEPDNLKTFLPDYLDHIRRNPNTLLPRYLGMYTFERISTTYNSKDNQSPGLNNINNHFNNNHNHINNNNINSMEASVAASFPLSQQQILPPYDEVFPQKMILVIMANVFDTPLTIHEKYDFKGSNVGRHTLPISTSNMPPTLDERKIEVSHLTLKDLDFQYRVFQGQTNLIHLGNKNKQELMNQLELDLNLLKKFAFMDYSLLVGIHRVPKSPKTNNTNISTPAQSIKSSRPNSIISNNRNYSPIPSPHTQTSIIQPFISQASNLLTSILHPNINSPNKQDNLEYFENNNLLQDAPTQYLTSNDTTPFIEYDHLNELSFKDGITSVKLPNQEIYFFGIIDILQKYTIVKWIEKGIKGYNARLLGNNVPVNTTPIFMPSIPNNNRPNSADSTLEINNNIKIDKKERKQSFSSSLPQDNPYLNIPKYESPEEESIIDNKANLNRSNTSPNKFSTPTFNPFPNQNFEFSVEEPNRYSERLIEYIRGIVV